jgi:hypothetical protein
MKAKNGAEEVNTHSATKLKHERKHTNVFHSL